MSTIRILGWTSTGFRCPDHEVSLEKPSKKPYAVTLIQMPNGTGKTTTLELLRASLSGRTQWGREELLALRSRDQPRTAVFVTRLLVDEKRATVRMAVDFVSRSVTFQTTKGGSKQEGFKPPTAVARVFTPEFTPFFIFDGELAQRLLDENGVRAEQAIDAHFQLSLLQRLSVLLTTYWEKMAAGKAKAMTGLTRRRNRLSDLERRRKVLETDRAQLLITRDSQSIERDRLRADWDEAFNRDRTAREQKQHLDQEHGRAAQNVERAVIATLELARELHAVAPNLAAEMVALRDNLDTLKLPEYAAKEFFEELAAAESCVCGEPMTEARRAAVIARKGMYLGQEDAGVINNVKSDIKVFVEGQPDAPSGLRASIETLEGSVRERDELATELLALEAKRLAEGDAEIAEKKSRFDAAEAQLSKTTLRIAEIDRAASPDDGDDSDCLAAIIALQAKAEADFAEITKTRETRQKVGELAEILLAAVSKARAEVREELVDATNARLKGLLSLTPIRLRGIGTSLVLDGQAKASQGQTLALGYAFLLSLFENGQLDLPFIVDSPTGALDLRVRREIAKILPQISNQLVLFTTSSEKDQFVPILHAAAKGNLQYMTLVRLSEASLKLLPSTSDSTRIQKTQNGALVCSKRFFERFDTATLDEK